MPSPFPGMDPFLEGSLWPDVHHALASEIRRHLAPRVQPRYVVRIEVHVVEDVAPEEEIGILYPDVEVLRARAPVGTDRPVEPAAEESSAASAPPLVIPALGPVEVRLASVELRTATGDALVTCIEILSPVNKREPGLTRYRQRRQRLREAGAHVLEIDLLRRGRRTIAHPRIPDRAAYLVALTRAGAGQTGVWPLALEDPLPRVPVPLRPPDPDATLDLGAALATVYDDARYDLSIDYGVAPAPPPLSGPELEVLERIRTG